MNRETIAEIFKNSGSDRNSVQKNRLSKQVEDLKLKKAQLKIRYQKDRDRLDQQIQSLREKISKIDR